MLDFLSPTLPDPEAVVRPVGEGIADPREILDTSGLDRRVDAIVPREQADPLAVQGALRTLFKQVLEEGRAVIRRRFLDGASGGDACVAEQAYLMDQVIYAIATVMTGRLYPAPNPTMGERLSIAAVGGYGRGELAPFSDIDLLFLLPYKRAPRVEQVVEATLYLLWDLGLKVGHATRTVDECIRSAKADHVIRTSLLELRPLWGDGVLVENLQRRFEKEVQSGTGSTFLEAKLAERDERHQKLGDSRYVLEPNIKDGKGGLRDLHSLYWIAKDLYRVTQASALVGLGVLTREEAREFDKAQTFLRTLRCHLHYLIGRAEERLTFDVQASVGAAMGYTGRASASGVERFMKHYFLTAKQVGDLTRILCAALEAERHRPPRVAEWGRNLLRLPGGMKVVDGFVLDSGRLTVPRADHFRNDPVAILRLFRTAQAHDLDIHPNALKAIRRSLRQIGPAVRDDPQANALFLDILAGGDDPELTLRRMNEASVLGKFVPDFGRVVCQMQYDMYHVYTTDEHTIFAMGMLHKVMTGQWAEHVPLATRVARKIKSRRALYVALFCHDIAKGRGGDHSVLGARVVRHLGPRLGLTDEETETAEWLVRWHLLMSDVALKRDLEDERSIRTFAEQVGSRERLRLLLVLTTCDINAVGPGRWNGWKATLLGLLYSRADELISGGFESDGREQRVKAAQDRLRARLTGFSPEAIDGHIDRLPAAYWLAIEPDAQLHHAYMIRSALAEGRPLTLETRQNPHRGVTEVTVFTGDHPGVFSRMAGALAVGGATIVDAKIFTRTDGLVLDVFNVQDAATGGAFDSADKLARLAVLIDRSMAGELKPRAELSRRKSALSPRTRVFKVQPRVLIDNDSSRTHTVVEVNGRDRSGLLYDVTRAIKDLALQISSAKVSTYGERAIDVFYVKDVFGLKVESKGKLRQVREGLLNALREPECAAAPVDSGKPKGKGTDRTAA